MRLASGVIRFPASASPSPFPTGPCGSYRTPSPARLHEPVHPPRSTPLQSPSVSSSARALLERRLLPWGCLSLIATLTGGIVTMGFPCPIAFRPRRFSRPRRFHPPPASWVCFTPQPRPGFTQERQSLSHSRSTSSVSRALSSLTRARYQWFDPPAPRSRASPTGLFSVRESVATNDGV
jgi:hypothetical protein